ncbi:MAG TPA: DUF4404 family protein [Gemmatimonadales bacterium]|nr:DUF4404 family protein [Gemmatimonadales bacterium]
MDEATRDRLQALQAEIAAVLERGEGEVPIRQRLEDGLAEFEASHPDLARRLAQVIDTLAFYNL